MTDVHEPITATEWLRQYLSDHKPHLVTEIQQVSRMAKFSWKQIRAAKARLRVKARNHTFWTLPPS